MYPFPINHNQIFEECLEKGLIKQIQGKEYEPDDEKPHWYKENQFCQYHQLKSNVTCFCRAF